MVPRLGFGSSRRSTPPGPWTGTTCSRRPGPTCSAGSGVPPTRPPPIATRSSSRRATPSAATCRAAWRRPPLVPESQRAPRGATREVVPEHLHLLPLRGGRDVPGTGCVDRVLDELHAVDVPGAVGEDALGVDLDHELGAIEGVDQGGVVVQRGDAVHAQAVRMLEVDEEHPEVRVHDGVPEAAEHAVAVIAREGQRLLVEDADKAGAPTLVGAVRPTVSVGGGEEEHRASFDEGPVVIGERVVHRDLLEAVGDPTAVETVLEVPCTRVVQVGHGAHGRASVSTFWYVTGKRAVGPALVERHGDTGPEAMSDEDPCPAEPGGTRRIASARGSSTGRTSSLTPPVPVGAASGRGRRW